MRAVISPNDVLDARRQLQYRSMLGNSSNRMLGTYVKMRALISPYDVLRARQYHKMDARRQIQYRSMLGNSSNGQSCFRTQL